jgi:hypothetical protein
VVVVDDAGVPINVVSLRDIIAALVSVPSEGYFDEYIRKITTHDV